MMFDIMQAVPVGYELQAWLVSAGAFSMMLVKTGMWVKGWKANGNGNGKTFLTLSEGEFRGEVRLLLDKQVTLMDKMHDNQAADKAVWGPAITELLTLQHSMADMLDKHATMLVEHDKHEKKVWEQMLGIMETFREDTRLAREQAFKEIASVKQEIRQNGI